MKSINSIFKTGAEYWIAGVLLLVHVLCISLPGREASLASSNLMTNMIRLEALPNAPDQALVLAGSSITGRLLPEYFSEESHPVINVGLDGCGSADAMVSILEQKPRPKVLLIEVNTLKPGYKDSMKVVNESISHWRVSAHAALPFLQSKERPVELLYDFMNERKNLKHADASSNAKLSWQEKIIHPATTALVVPQSGAMAEVYTNARASLLAFKAKGTKVALVVIPNSYVVDECMAVSQKLATELEIPLFDLRECANAETLSWTDGIHLTRHAAREIVRFIEADVLPRIK